MKKILSMTILAGIFAFAGIADTAMMGGSSSYTDPVTMMMTNTGGFGMINGMACMETSILKAQAPPCRIYIIGFDGDLIDKIQLQ
ncbi:hypothetical protein NBG4_460021 [Candidatus Sulfobium mesophilum]|uniref:Uncharacterized protein n=1 Tax=Candidatus Sulfobium mesophilum TaxID=2016548 RepID=A0A2U3QIJ2_9BACT|nr:hypothetical protein NBG4_460021 [Candidatus Sulfobium mesophilum]